MKFRWGNMQLMLSDETPPVPQPLASDKKKHDLHWNQDNLKWLYDRCIRDFEGYGFSTEDMERLKNEQLSAKEFKTSSDRIQRMIVTAYYIGKMVGIRECDHMFDRIAPSEKE